MMLHYELKWAIGIVKGSTIRARHLGRDIMAGLRSVVGGEVTEYTKMMAESREQGEWTYTMTVTVE